MIIVFLFDKCLFSFWCTFIIIFPRSWAFIKYIILSATVVFFTIILCVHDYCLPSEVIVIYETRTGDEAPHYKALPKL